MRNAENQRPNTKHQTPKTIMTFNPKSAIQNPKSREPESARAGQAFEP
jgi:hypothetical protein